MEVGAVRELWGTGGSKAMKPSVRDRRVLGRHAFLNQLESYCELSQRRRQLALVLVDIHRFEWVNEAFGFAVGDRVLANLSGVMGRGAGPDAVVGRLDGDEFGVLAFVGSQSMAMKKSEICPY